MRVVVVNDVSVARGGATALALLEAQLLAERGIAVGFATGDTGDSAALRAIGAPVVALGEKKLLEAGRGAVLRGIYNRKTLEVLGASFAAADTPDTIYHVHGWSQILSPSLFDALAPYRGRVVISAHDFFLACPNGAYADFRAGRACARKPLGLACLAAACDKRGYSHKLWRVGRQFVQRRTLALARSRPLVLMIHESMREPLRRAGAPDDRLQALPNPVTAWSQRRIAAERNRRYIFVGRFTEEKGPDLAARAARLAGVPMTFIGDGPMLGPLRAQYPEFDFPGRLAPVQVRERAAFARALIMPSRYPEPYGLVAVEAMWSGLPALVARDALLAPEIVRRRAGLAFDPRDVTAFAEALRAAGDDERLRSMSVNAFGATRDLGLTTGAWADRLIDAFHGLLATRPASSGAATLAPGGIESEHANVFDGHR